MEILIFNIAQSHKKNNTACNYGDSKLAVQLNSDKYDVFSGVSQSSSPR